MPSHRFTLTIALDGQPLSVLGWPEPLMESLAYYLRDDGTLASTGDTLRISFDREADSAANAVTSALLAATFAISHVQRRAALDELAAQAQEFDMGYDPANPSGLARAAASEPPSLDIPIPAEKLLPLVGGPETKARRKGGKGKAGGAR